MRSLIALLLGFCLAAPAGLGAWGFDVHRLIVQEAIPLLPGELRPFFEKNRVVFIEHSIDPDLWRNVGFAEEPPRHFLDLDAYGAHPFDALPRDYEAAVKKYGKEMIDRNGLLPWRAAEIHALLVRAFERAGKGQPYGLTDVPFFSAVLAHYASDAHVPFHAILNHDGQLTSQNGIHSRFESELVSRFRPKLVIRTTPRAPIRSPRDFIFDTLIDGAALAGGVLQADRDAAAGEDEYGDAYFERFFAGARPVLERRIGEAASAVAALVAGAWEQAGRPALALDPPRTVRKIVRPGA